MGGLMFRKVEIKRNIGFCQTTVIGKLIGYTEYNGVVLAIVKDRTGNYIIKRPNEIKFI